MLTLMVLAFTVTFCCCCYSSRLQFDICLSVSRTLDFFWVIIYLHHAAAATSTLPDDVKITHTTYFTGRKQDWV